jgi:hypothetical protein
MEVLGKNCVDVTIKFSLDEVMALKQSIGNRVPSSRLDDIRRSLDYLTDQIESLDSKLECEKAERTILLKNIREDLEML